MRRSVNEYSKVRYMREDDVNELVEEQVNVKRRKIRVLQPRKRRIMK
ncbi:hypothetical protein [Rossellomorea aquimaris]|nr:hypothetical protein [Rossellomorea aquimaris]